MNKKKRKKISVLILLLVITIGYALLSTTLKINGIANIKSNTWDIHFENVVANTESTVTAELPSITDNATKVSYEVDLSLPGDFYEFTVDAVNDGSINGIIEKIDHKVYESDGITEATLPSYIKYSIVYDGTTTAPQEGDILEAGESKTYRVRIEFDSEATTLPSTDLTYVIVDEVKYTQTKESEEESDVPPEIQNKMNQIIANPDSFRNQDQSSTNKDIGLDDQGNVINLDMWVDNDQYVGTKAYFLNSETHNTVIVSGNPEYWDSEYEYYTNVSISTPATSAANVIDGEVKAAVPAYVMFAGTNKFYPVTRIEYIFGNVGRLSSSPITVMPHIPNTVKEIGAATFMQQEIENITIPKNVCVIEREVFRELPISNLTFESGSCLKEIGYSAFYDSDLYGDLTLPQSVEFIDRSAFYSNNLTSVTFPSSATYFENQEYEWNNSFDQGVTINHNY